MQQQVGTNHAVGLDNAVHCFRMGRFPLPGGGGGDHGFEIDFVGVQQQADERHLVIGFIADVADDDHSWMTAERVWRRRLD